MHRKADILKLLVAGDHATISRLYHDCYPAIEQLILKNTGDTEDAEDVFQEALVVVYRQAKKGSLVLTCALSTYIYAIFRNIWLDRLRKSGRTLGFISEHEQLVDLESDVLATIQKNEQYALYQKHFQNLSEGCRKLLTLFFEALDMKAITKAMGFGSELYARKRKFQCKEKLVNSIRSDPAYSEIKEGNNSASDTINP
ncbi:MAG: sigma-70 family RNA polymerase sigma factor [Cyclobacteriaceae bacterium]